MRRLPWFLMILLLVVPLFADDDDDDDEGMAWTRGPDPEVAEVDDEKAEAMIDELDRVRKSKDENEIIAALEPFITASNEKFFKALDRYVKHRIDNVRVVATHALGSQKEPAKKIGSLLYSLMKSRQNKKSRPVVAMTISSLRRLKFDKKPVVDEIVSHFRKQKDERIMRECVRYFGDLKRKETVRLLIGWVEAPQPANVNSEKNPPASYWRRMWEIWDEIDDVVMEALEKITELEFENQEEWQEWFKSPEAKRAGYR